MLLSQNRSWYKNGDLFTVHDRFKCSPNRDLCFAVPNIAANQPVHRFGFFHVLFHL